MYLCYTLHQFEDLILYQDYIQLDLISVTWILWFIHKQSIRVTKSLDFVKALKLSEVSAIRKLKWDPKTVVALK